MQQELSKKTTLRKDSVKNNTHHKTKKAKPKFSRHHTPVPPTLVKPSSSLQRSPKNIPQSWISWLVEKQSTLNQKKPNKLQKLVHHLIRQGKKTRALKLVRHSFHYLTVDIKNVQTSFSPRPTAKVLIKAASPRRHALAPRGSVPKASSLTTSSTPSQKEIYTKNLSKDKIEHKELLNFDQKTFSKALGKVVTPRENRQQCPSPFPQYNKSVSRHLTNYSKAHKSASPKSTSKAVGKANKNDLLSSTKAFTKDFSETKLSKTSKADKGSLSHKTLVKPIGHVTKKRFVNGKLQLKNASTKNPITSSLSIFRLALQKVRPFFHLRKARKAGVNIQVPAILPPQNQDSLAIQWLIEGAKTRKKKESRQSFAYHLAQEIRVAALRPKESYAFQKREEGAKQVQTHRNAARFRWW
jgi:ribosomal protein S7